ncbi:MAG: Ig-like domain-containing protein [Prevotellaceae bacterium]|nr:Ig-like domain-containing protein [Prevotellaceae bacterium]
MLTIAAFAAVLVSCNKDDDTTPPVEVVSVTVTPPTLLLEVGEKQTLTATVEPNNAVDKTVAWSSSDSEIAAVNVSTGEVTAKAEGIATITAATANGKKATCAVTVLKDIIVVTSVTVDTLTLSLKKDEKYTLKATVEPSDASDKTITWSSSDSEIADVDTSTGEVTAKAGGTATITATTTNGKTATCAVTVIIEATSVTVDRTLSLEVGETKTLRATIEPSDVSDKTITWSSGDPEIAEIDPSTGEITAKAIGTTTVTATTVNGKTATCDVTVSKTIVLQSPDDNSAVDLTDTDAVTFSWDKVEEVTGYTLKFAPSPYDPALLTFDLGDEGSLTMYAQEVDVILADLQVPLGGSVEIYWTVAPTEATPNIATQFRKLQITRSRNLPFRNIAGAYKGTVTILLNGGALPSYENVKVYAEYISGDSILFVVPGNQEGFILQVEIKIACKITSDETKYSFLESTTVIFPLSGDEVRVEGTMNTTEFGSYITDTGKANLDLSFILPGEVIGAPGITLDVGFRYDGQKE